MESNKRVTVAFDAQRLIMRLDSMIEGSVQCNIKYQCSVAEGLPDTGRALVVYLVNVAYYDQLECVAS